MDKASTSLAVFLLFILRCLVPLFIMLGVSYLLKRLGFIKETPSRPAEPDQNKNGDNNINSNHEGLVHGSP